MTLYLLKVHLQTSLYIPITQKYQILSCDTLVANERYVLAYIKTVKKILYCLVRHEEPLLWLTFLIISESLLEYIVRRRHWLGVNALLVV